MGLGEMSAREVVDLMDRQESLTLAAVQQRAQEIVAAAERIAACMTAGGRVFMLGSGTSGRIAVQEVSELRPTFGIEEGRFVAFVAGGPSAGPAAITRSEDDERAAPDALKRLGLGSTDVVIGVAASGSTPFVLAGQRVARQVGAWTCAIVNNPDTPAAELADLCIYLATGPELLTGSTRLQAATAQKLTLNRITVAAMVLDGRVIENHMVDVVVSIAKLQHRAVRIVGDLAGLDAARAREQLIIHSWRVRDVLDEYT